MSMDFVPTPNTMDHGTIGAVSPYQPPPPPGAGGVGLQLVPALVPAVTKPMSPPKQKPPGRPLAQRIRVTRRSAGPLAGWKRVREKNAGSDEEPAHVAPCWPPLRGKRERSAEDADDPDRPHAWRALPPSGSPWTVPPVPDDDDVGEKIPDLQVSDDEADWGHGDEDSDLDYFMHTVLDARHEPRQDEHTNVTAYLTSDDAQESEQEECGPIVNDEPDLVEIAWTAECANAFFVGDGPGGRKCKPGEVLVMRYKKEDTKKVFYDAVIERELNILTKDDEKHYWRECRDAKKKELNRWATHRVMKRLMRKDAKNLIDSRWVLKFKVISGERQVKARLTVRGFKDKQAHKLDRYAATGARWSQRLVCSTAAQNCWPIWSLDVSIAFLRGKTFEEIAKKLGVSNERTLQFDLPRDGPELFRGTTEEFRAFDERVETLDMIRPGFGTTDAPWAWSLDLHEFLTSQGFKPTTADSKLYVLHVNGCSSAQVVVHVDDLKGASPAKVRDWIFSIFKERYDEITTSEPPFECVGIFHTQAPDYTIQISQDHYIKQLRPMVVPGLENLSDDIFVAWSVIALFQSLLGAIAWLSLTRGDTLVFVGRFQRCSKQPTAKDVRYLNKLLKWVKRKTCVITYATLTPPIGLASIADSAYRADDEDCLALRAAIFVIIEVRKGVPGGRMHVLDYYSKTQSRVNRSTFSAELNNLL